MERKIDEPKVFKVEIDEYQAKLYDLYLYKEYLENKKDDKESEA